MSLLFGTSLCSFWGFDNRCVGIHLRKQLVQWSFGMKTHELKLGSSALYWFTSTYDQSASYLIDRFPAKFFNAKFTDLKSRPQTTLFFRLSFGVRLFDDWVIHIVCHFRKKTSSLDFSPSLHWCRADTLEIHRCDLWWTSISSTNTGTHTSTNADKILFRSFALNFFPSQYLFLIICVGIFR